MANRTSEQRLEESIKELDKDACKKWFFLWSGFALFWTIVAWTNQSPSFQPCVIFFALLVGWYIGLVASKAHEDNKVSLRFGPTLVGSSLYNLEKDLSRSVMVPTVRPRLLGDVLIEAYNDGAIVVASEKS